MAPDGQRATAWVLGRRRARHTSQRSPARYKWANIPSVGRSQYTIPSGPLRRLRFPKKYKWKIERDSSIRRFLPPNPLNVLNPLSQSCRSISRSRPLCCLSRAPPKLLNGKRIKSGRARPEATSPPRATAGPCGSGEILSQWASVCDTRSAACSLRTDRETRIVDNPPHMSSPRQ